MCNLNLIGAEKSPRFTKREENFDRFLQWLTEHGVSTDNVTIERFDKEGWGLRAQNDISVSNCNTVPKV